MTSEVRSYLIDTVLVPLLEGKEPDLSPGSSLRTAAPKGVDLWFMEFGEAVYGTKTGIWDPVSGVFGTVYKDQTIYLHILDPEAFSKLRLPIPEARILDCETIEGTPLFWMIQDDLLSIDVPREYLGEAPVDTIVTILCDQKL